MPKKPKQKERKVKAWIGIWSDKSKQVFWKRLKAESRPSGLTIYPCTITYVLPSTKHKK